MSDHDKTNYSQADILRFAERDLVIGCRARLEPNILSTDYLDAYSLASTVCNTIEETAGSGSMWVSIVKSLLRLPHSNRMIGVVNGINDDDSMDITILGTDLLNLPIDGKKAQSIIGICSRNDLKTGADENEHFDFSTILTYNRTFMNIVRGETRVTVGYDDSERYDLSDVFDFTPTWKNYDIGTYTPPFFTTFCKYQGNNIAMGTNRFQLTNNKNNTLRLGVGVDMGFPLSTDDTARCGHEIYEGMAGNLYEMLMNWCSFYIPTINGSVVPTDTMAVSQPWIAYVGTYAMQWKPYNLILTESYDMAQNYLATGNLPTDAWIYPFDPNDFPTNNPVTPDDEDDTGGDEDDDTQPVKHIPDTPHETPVVTPQAITNNNLYWLQAGELAGFINWFWTDAGTILDAGDLWDKLKGLYNDLASAVLNVRFMPIDISWIGGATQVNSIIVGQIEKPGQVLAINKVNPTVRPLGTVSIQKLKKNWTDYAPNCELQLYLPFHGFMTLDNDILQGETLKLECVYDIISGTIQYMIYCNNTLINTCLAKMAVDIPITLQSKSDRDSAIFNNVTNTTANLLGAGASFGVGVATGNPAGMTIATMQGVSALQGGKQIAPLKVYGTSGESGAFYVYATPFVMIKHSVPKYPKLYKSRIGYPSNKVVTLRNATGFVICANPVINFGGNTVVAEGTTKKIKPLQSEVDEIYSLLEKGVII